ncbi:MAG: hypothetical protein HKN94_17220 [Acidimicrobiales bacterium]|nr:hypothetical protein [Acidimicrobiales bacterium]RZV43452.1 MAG: hypothetical protein EX269_13250 [Acidimicrobiales bacterium]
MRSRPQLAAAALVVVVVLLGFASPAIAGGSWFDPVKDRYEPGEQATLVGYTGGGAYGWIEDGPYFGFLMESADEGGAVADGIRLPLGEIVLEETGRGGYLRLRASISFQIPSDLEPALYQFDYCNADCSARLGDLIGGAVWVGVDPEYPISREWPLDDPEVANLAADALIAGPGFQVEAGEVQSGAVGINAGGMPTAARATVAAPTTSSVPSSVAEVSSTPTTGDITAGDDAIAEAISEFRPDSSGTNRGSLVLLGGSLVVLVGGFSYVVWRRRSATT